MVCEDQTMRKLFLDDTLQPPDITWDVVRSYDDFVYYIETHGVPDVISFDHDLAFEHYPFAEDNPEAKKIPYDRYTEKTGYDCAKWLVENGGILATLPMDEMGMQLLGALFRALMGSST